MQGFRCREKAAEACGGFKGREGVQRRQVVHGIGNEGASAGGACKGWISIAQRTRAAKSDGDFCRALAVDRRRGAFFLPRGARHRAMANDALRLPAKGPACGALSMPVMKRRTRITHGENDVAYV